MFVYGRDDMSGAFRIDLPLTLSMAAPDAGIGGGVKDAVGFVRHSLADTPGVGHIAKVNVDVAGGQITQVAAGATKCTDLPALLQQLLHQVAANKSGSAGDQGML